jgi:hypothetical protein
MTKQPPSAVLGRWRIVAIRLGCRLHRPDRTRHIQFDPDGGHIAFGAVQIVLDCWYGYAGAHFAFIGRDEGTEVHGDSDAEIEDDGTLQGEIHFQHGDDMPFVARRE